MDFDERNEGNYRIYAGALDAPNGGGFIAAVVVCRRGTATEAFRDTSMAGGYRWKTAHEALTYAVGRAREVIRHELQQLAA